MFMNAATLLGAQRVAHVDFAGEVKL